MVNHAELIHQYGLDCVYAGLDAPWELWEMRTANSDVWRPCKFHPAWWPNFQYRRIVPQGTDYALEDLPCQKEKQELANAIGKMEVIRAIIHDECNWKEVM